jgi:hypothetical protein
MTTAQENTVAALTLEGWRILEPAHVEPGGPVLILSPGGRRFWVDAGGGVVPVFPPDPPEPQP